MQNPIPTILEQTDPHPLLFNLILLPFLWFKRIHNLFF